MREVELRRIAEPRCVCRVVGEVVVGVGVDEDVQPAAMRVEPGDEPVEVTCIERELAAPARVRADELFVDAAHLHAELRCGLLAQRPSLSDRVLVEVDMRVIVLVQVLGALRHAVGAAGAGTVTYIGLPSFRRSQPFAMRYMNQTKSAKRTANPITTRSRMQPMTPHSSVYQNVRICQRKWLSSHVPAT